jgi:hypothetical protein
MTLIKVNYDLLSNFIVDLKIFAPSLFQNTDFYLKKTGNMIDFYHPRKNQIRNFIYFNLSKIF